MDRHWELKEDGTISQSLIDVQDPDIRLFTETVKAHNQAIQDKKAKK